MRRPSSVNRGASTDDGRRITDYLLLVVRAGLLQTLHHRFYLFSRIRVFERAGDRL